MHNNEMDNINLWKNIKSTEGVSDQYALFSY